MSHSTHAEFPAQLMLPGQAAAPEGPIDMEFMYLAHHGFRRDLDNFVEAVRHTPLEDRFTWQRLAARWEVFSILLHEHHEGEDTVTWPTLRERTTGSDRELLDAMEAEHAQIDPLLESCARGFERLEAHEDPDARAALVVRITATRDCLDQHLAHEESDAIAMIQRVMTAEDYADVEARLLKTLTPRKAVRLVPWVAYAVPRDALDKALAKAGIGFRVLYRLTRRSFEGRERRAFRYVA